MKRILLTILLYPLLAIGSPHPGFQALVNERASMLDIVMLRLQDYIFWQKQFMPGEYHIAGKTAKQPHIDMNASYHADDGYILLSASLMDLESAPDQIKAGCDALITRMRINLYKSLPGLFIHTDGRFPPNSEALQSDMANLIQLKCSVHGGSTTEVAYTVTEPLALENMPVAFWEKPN